MKLSLRAKLFLFVPIIALVPWLGYQTLTKLQQFAIQAQTESLRVLADSLRPAVNKVDSKSVQKSLVLVPEPLNRKPSIDGFFDEWSASPQLTGDELSLMIGQFDDIVYFAATVSDATRFYQEPLFGRPEAVPFDYLKFIGLGPNEFSIQFAPEASGRFSANFLQQHIQNNNAHKVDAYWWETSTGYRLEWGIPAKLIEREILEILYYDHNWLKPLLRLNRFSIEPLSGELQRFVRQLAGESRQILVIDNNKRVIAKTPPLKNIPSLLVSDADLLKGSIAGQYIRLSVPVRTDKGFDFYVVILAPASELVGESKQAIIVLAWQTLGVIIILIFGLSIYSGSLAERIKRLRTDLKSHLDDRGRFNEDARLSSAKSNDEVGELSRDIEIVLNDLRRYTMFLERIPKTLKHELSNPMSAIQTSLDLLADEDDAKQQVRLRAIAMRGIQKLESTLGKVTEAASLEEALRDEGVFAFDASKVVRDAVDASSRSYPTIYWNLEVPEIQLIISGNDFRFEQLLDKLIDNAIAFVNDNGWIKVELIDGITTAALIVENSGTPIAERTAQTAFQIFSGTRNDSTGSHLGLGLYVVRLIAESMKAVPTIENTADGVRVMVSGFRVK